MEQKADDATLAAQHHHEESPLRWYLAALYEGDQASRLLRQIGVFVYQANLTGEQHIKEFALEVLQETVATALKAEERFDPTRSPFSWLLGIANKIVMQRRDKLYRLNRNETTQSDLTTGTPSPNASHGGISAGAGSEAMDEETIMDRLLARHNHTTHSSLEQEVIDRITLEALLSQLTPDERRVIELNIVHELKAAEVARELGIQEVNARVRHSRALKKLRSLYMAQVQDPCASHRILDPASSAEGGAINVAINDGEKQSHE